MLETVFGVRVVKLKEGEPVDDVQVDLVGGGGEQEVEGGGAASPRGCRPWGGEEEGGRAGD